MTLVLALMPVSRPRIYLQSKPCFVISSKVLIHEISRVRQLPPSSQYSISPEILGEDLDRMMGSLEMLIPLYPGIGNVDAGYVL